jgi:hypothetical protein
MALFYANGGPGPATKLYRVDVPTSGGVRVGAWQVAPAGRWSVEAGWQPYSDAQADITLSGEFFLIDESQVLDVQHEMLLTFERFHTK